MKHIITHGRMAWITDLRMRLASNLLQDRGAGLKQIAARVGYASPTSFSAAFKRWAGHAPSQCRAGSPGTANSGKPTATPVGSCATDH